MQMRSGKPITWLNVIQYGGFAFLLVLPFSVFFVVMAIRMDAPFFFVLFGIGFGCFVLLQLGLMVFGVITASQNAVGQLANLESSKRPEIGGYEKPRRKCTYCGCGVEHAVAECPNCGANI